MNILQALAQLKNSDIAIYTEEGAKEICTALSVPLLDVEWLHWNTIDEAKHTLGFNALFAPGNGIYGFELIDHIANAFGLNISIDGSLSAEQTKGLLRAIEEKLISTGQLDVRHWWLEEIPLESGISSSIAPI